MTPIVSLYKENLEFSVESPAPPSLLSRLKGLWSCNFVIEYEVFVYLLRVLFIHSSSTLKSDTKLLFATKTTLFGRYCLHCYHANFRRHLNNIEKPTASMSIVHSSFHCWYISLDKLFLLLLSEAILIMLSLWIWKLIRKSRSFCRWHSMHLTVAMVKLLSMMLMNVWGIVINFL